MFMLSGQDGQSARLLYHRFKPNRVVGDMRRKTQSYRNR